MTTDTATRLTQADPAACRAAARCLGKGGLVGFPTETVYALAADATNREAVARLYAVTGRRRSFPLIAHVPDLASAQDLAHFDDAAEWLGGTLWPGPLTLVLPRLPGCPIGDLATAQHDAIAVRVADHPVVQRILAAFGKPIVAIPASRADRVAATHAAHVLADLRGRIDLVVNGGATRIGIESTVVACFGAPVLLRPGGVPRDALQSVLGRAIPDPAMASARDDAPLSPEMFASHAAPKTPLRRDAVALQAGEALLAFGPVPAWADQAGKVLTLSQSGDVAEAAANLFAHLRALDATAPAGIAVMPIPRDGLGEAINDRLARAIAHRPGGSGQGVYS